MRDGLKTIRVRQFNIDAGFERNAGGCRFINGDVMYALQLWDAVIIGDAALRGDPLLLEDLPGRLVRELVPRPQPRGENRALRGRRSDENPWGEIDLS